VHHILQLRRSSAPQVSLPPLQKVHGSLVHICFVHQAGRSWLGALQQCISAFKSPHSQRILPESVLSDLDWWEAQLVSPGTFHMLVDQGPPLELGISVDASTDFGVGLWVHNSYKAWALHPRAVGVKGHDISWLESLAIEFAIHYLDV
jgi:hypothetical protein